MNRMEYEELLAQIRDDEKELETLEKLGTATDEELDSFYEELDRKQELAHEYRTNLEYTNNLTEEFVRDEWEQLQIEDRNILYFLYARFKL